MTLQRSYDVTDMEGGEPPKSALVNRSCILPLLGFLLSCAVILMVCLLVRRTPDAHVAPGQAEHQVKDDNDVEPVNHTSNASSNPQKQNEDYKRLPPTTINDEVTGQSIPASNTQEDLEPQKTATNGAADEEVTEQSTVVSNTKKDVKQQKTVTNGAADEEVTEQSTVVSNTKKDVKQQKTVAGGAADEEVTEQSAVVSNTKKDVKQQKTVAGGAADEEVTEQSAVVSNTKKDVKQQKTVAGGAADEEVTERSTVGSNTQKDVEPQKNVTNGAADEEVTEQSTVVSNTKKDVKQQKTVTDGAADEEVTEQPTVVSNTQKEVEPQKTVTDGAADEKVTEQSAVVSNTEKDVEPQKNVTNGAADEEVTEQSTVVSNTQKDVEPQTTVTDGVADEEVTEQPTVVSSTQKEVEPQKTVTDGAADEEVTEQSTVVSNTQKDVEPQTTVTDGNSTTTELQRTIPPSENTKNGKVRFAPPSTTANPQTDVHLHLGRQMASKMLFYMNHSADACEDLYEYACGGFEANHLLSENEGAKQATQRIYDQAKEVHSSNGPEEFLVYYQSCVTHYTHVNEIERIKLAKPAIDEIVNLCGSNEGNDENFNLTSMLSELLLRNSAPLFDVIPDIAVDEQGSCEGRVNSAKFTLKLRPPELMTGLFETEMEEKCKSNDASVMRNKVVDLERVYTNYSACKNHVPDFLDSMERALEAFGVDATNARFTVDNLIAKFVKKYPAEGEIRKAYTSKEYKLMKIKSLQNGTNESFLNWTRLLQTLTDSRVDFEQPLQVYFSDLMVEELASLSDTSPESVYDALLGVYAHKIYYEFVVLPRDVENHCKRMATDLMETHASSLYMSSFSTDELGKMKTAATSVFENLKSTLVSGLTEVSWLKVTSDTPIIKKIRELSIAVPDPSYYVGTGALNPEKSGIKGSLTGNFVDDTMMLQRNYRKLLYQRLDKSPSDDEQIWTHFAQPFQTTASAIYELNKIIIPYGAIDWAIVKNAKRLSADHLILATLGTRIADQIAHHFDATGIQYNANKRNKEQPIGFCGDDSAAQTYADYVVNYKSLSADSINQIVLPSTQQNVQYQLTDLSLNERLSAITGLQLAYDTLLRTPSNSKTLLPWLNNQENDEQKQFFLAYAQMHCTNVPLTSSFVSLYEDERLPSRLKISAVATANEALGRTFECRSGSGGRPEYSASVFPHLDIND